MKSSFAVYLKKNIKNSIVDFFVKIGTNSLIRTNQTKM